MLVHPNIMNICHFATEFFICSQTTPDVCTEQNELNKISIFITVWSWHLPSQKFVLQLPQNITTLFYVSFQVENQRVVLRCKYLEFELQFSFLDIIWSRFIFVIHDLLMLWYALYAIHIPYCFIFEHTLVTNACFMVFLVIVSITNFDAKSPGTNVRFFLLLSFDIHSSSIAPVQTSTTE